MRPSHILLVDGERSIRLMLETGLAVNGFRVTCVRTGREALSAAAAGTFDAALAAAEIPELRDVNLGIPVVWISSQGKPPVIGEVVSALRRALASQEFIGRSAPMLLVDKLIAQAARTDATVLITG